MSTHRWRRGNLLMMQPDSWRYTNGLALCLTSAAQIGGYLSVPQICPGNILTYSILSLSSAKLSVQGSERNAFSLATASMTASTTSLPSSTVGQFGYMLPWVIYVLSARCLDLLTRTCASGQMPACSRVG